MNPGHFIIGDIHGCFLTFQALLEHWQPKEEILVCVGDYIDRGNYSDKVYALCRDLEKAYDDQVVFLKGNHESIMIKHYKEGHNQLWLDHGGRGTVAQFDQDEARLEAAAEWFDKRPLYYESDQLFVSHAGLSETESPFEEDNPMGVVWSRSPLKKLEKLQVHGHRPLRAHAPQYTEASHSWNIDTGACYGFGLTALRVASSGQTEWLFEPVNSLDTENKPPQ